MIGLILDSDVGPSSAMHDLVDRMRADIVFGRQSILPLAASNSMTDVHNRSLGEFGLPVGLSDQYGAVPSPVTHILNMRRPPQVRGIHASAVTARMRGLFALRAWTIHSFADVNVDVSIGTSRFEGRVTRSTEGPHCTPTRWIRKYLFDKPRRFSIESPPPLGIAVSPPSQVMGSTPTSPTSRFCSITAILLASLHGRKYTRVLNLRNYGGDPDDWPNP